MIRAALAAVLVAALAVPVLSAPARVTALDAGGARAFVQADPAVPVAGVLLTVRAGLDRQTTAQNGLAALTAESVLRTPSGATTLTDAVDAAGAEIGYAVGVQSVRFYLEGTPESIARAAPLVAAALAAPASDAATLAAARTAVAERDAEEEGDPRLVGRAALRASYYRGGAGLRPFGSAASVAALGAADVQAFYAAWYLRGDAVAAAVGRTGDATDAASRGLLLALRTGTARSTPVAVRAFGAEPRRIVTHRDVRAPFVVLGFAAPSLGRQDFAAALVVRALLGSIFAHTGAATLPAVFQPVGLSYDYGSSPAQLFVWINGGRLDPEQGLAGLGAIARAAASKPLAAAVLARYKETARGEWALESAGLDERASAIGAAVSNGLDAGAPGDVPAAIARVTAADVVRVAKRYFQKFDVALVLPRESG